MNKKEFIIEKNPDETFLFLDGFDDAILGTSMNTEKVIYSVNKIIEILKIEMSYDDAIDYFYHNIESSYMGVKTPIYCYDLF
jgi:hypothetical protein